MYQPIFYKSNRKRTQYLILMLTLFSISLVFELLARIWTYYKIIIDEESYLYYNESTINAFNLADNLEKLSTLLLIPCSVMFLLWFRRAYFNMKERIGFTYFADYWTILAWFIPILNLYRPYSIMKELSEEGFKYIEENRLNPSEKLTQNDIKLWWGIWIISSVCASFRNNFYDRIKTSEDLKNYILVYIFVTLLFITAALIFSKLVQKYNEMELSIQQHIDQYNENLSLKSNELTTETY